LISFEDELTGFESVLLKVFQPGGQDYPAIITGTPQLPPGQFWKLSGKTLEVLGGGVNPDAVSAGMLDAVPQ